MARNVATYISNLGKSVVYSTVDKVKKDMPAVAEYKETNQELFKDIYDNIYNFRSGMKRSYNIFKSSSIYEAADTYKTNLIRDIKNGTFYNKQSEDKINEKILGLDKGGLGPDLDSDLGLDDNDFDIGGWDDEDNDDDYESSSSGRNAAAISMAIAKTGEYVVENQRASNNVFYAQAIKSNRMTTSSLQAINSNIGSMMNFSNDVIKVHVENSKNYYEQTTKYMAEQLNLIKDIHKKLVLDAQQGGKEEEKKKTKFDDLVGANGAVDIAEYFKHVKKNVTNQLSTFDMFSGMDGNPLLAFAASPLKFIPNAIAKKIIPDMVSNSMKQLDESISGLFGSIISRFNHMRKSDNPIANTIGQLFGITNRTTSSIDTSKYEKGPIPWDGQAKKALTEVIPNQLAEIISLISGKEKKIYDFDKGKFTNASDIAGELENIGSKYAKQASSDMRSEFDKMMEFVTFNSLEERNQFNKDIDKFFEKIFHSGIMFNPNNKDMQDYFSDISEKNFALINKMFGASKRSTQLKFNGQMLNARDREYAEMQKLEKDGGIITNLFNNSGISKTADKNKETSKNSIVQSIPNIKTITDNKGNNVFYYLQNMYKQLVMLNSGSYGGNGVSRRPVNTVVDYNGNTTSFGNDEFEIPDNRKVEDKTSKQDRQERENKRYLEKERKRLEKIQYKISMSDLEDGKAVSNKFDTALDIQRIKTQIDNERNSRKRGLINKLIEADTVSDKMKVLLNRVDDISKKPINFFARTLDKVDQRLYEVIYGDKESNGSNVGFMDALVSQIKNTFKNLNNWLDDHVLTPIKEKLDVDDFREIPKALLKKVGIDLDEIKENIKDKLFGENGIFQPMKEGIKNAFKGAFETAKNSVKGAFEPLTSKIKFNRRSNEIRDELNNLDETAPIDEPQQNPINRMRGPLMMNGINMDEYSKMSNKDRETYLKNYLNYRDNVGVSNAEMMAEAQQKKAKELERYNRYRNLYKSDMNKIQQAMDNNIDMSENEYNGISARLRQSERNMNIYKGRIKDATDYIHNVTVDRQDYENHRQRLDVINKQNIARESKEYYGDKLQKLIGLEDGSDVTALQKVIARYAYKNYKDDAFIDKMTIPALLQSASWFAKNSKDSGSYESLISKLKDFSTAAEIKDGMSVEDIIKRNISKVNKNEPETDLENYRGLIDGRNENGSLVGSFVFDKLLNSVQNIEKYVFTIMSKSIRKASNVTPNDEDGFTEFVKDLPVPTNTHPALKSNEGQAMKQVASKIGDLVANWFGGNIRQFAEGGGIDKTQMVTVSEGEAVLNKEDVKTLSELMSKLTDSIVTKKDRSSKIAKDNFGPLVDMAKRLGLEEKDQILSLLDQYKDKDAVDAMDKKSKSRYDKIINTLGSTVSKASVLKDEVSTKVEKDVKPFIQQAGDTIRNGAIKASDSLFGRKPEEEREKGFKFLSNTMKDAKKYLPELSGGAVLGAGLSLLTGGILGPIAGAAIGAGVSLTKKSETVQEWLFGKMGEDGNREGGLIGGNTIKTMKKYLPDVKQYGITGGLAGLLPFLPFGPVGGVMLGSAFAYAKNNDSIQKALFGKDGEKGLIPTEAIKKIKKIVPNVSLGAAGGLLFGPFGLLGNLILGSGVGYLSTSEKFQKMLLGTYNPNTKQYEDGILPDIRERFITPLRDDMKDITKKIGEFVDKEMLDPLRSALKPITKQLQLIGKGAVKGVGKVIDKITGGIFGVPISQVIRRKIIQPLSDAANTIRTKTMSIVKTVITAPFKAIGKVGETLTRRQIRNGNADYMTAEERLEWRKTHKMRGLRERAYDKFIRNNEGLKSKLPKSLVNHLENNLTGSKDKTLKADEYLANAGYSELEDMKNSLGYIKGNRHSRRKNIKNYSDKIVNTVFSAFGDSTSTSDIKKALKSFKKADAKTAFEYLGIDKLDKNTRKSLKNYADQFTNEKNYTQLSKDKVSYIFDGEENKDEIVKDVMNLYSKGDMEGLQDLLKKKLPKKEASYLFKTLTKNIDLDKEQTSNRVNSVKELKELFGDDLSDDAKERIINRLSRGQTDLAEAMLSAHKINGSADIFKSMNDEYLTNTSNLNKEIKDLTEQSRNHLKSGLSYKDQIDKAIEFVTKGDNKGLEYYLSKTISDENTRNEILEKLQDPLAGIKEKKEARRDNLNGLRERITNDDNNIKGITTGSRLLRYIDNGEYDKVEKLLKKKSRKINLNSTLDALESLYDDTDEYGKYTESSQQQGKVIKELEKKFKKMGIEYNESNSDSFYDNILKELKNRRPDFKEEPEKTVSKDNTEEELLKTEKENHNEIVNLFKDAINLLKELNGHTVPKESKGVNNKIGEINEKGKFVPEKTVRFNNEEHGVMAKSANSLANHILSWFEGNLTQYATGGFIEKPKMATLSAGEFVLNKTNTSELFGLSKISQEQLDSSQKNHNQIVKLFTSAINIMQHGINPLAAPIRFSSNIDSTVKNVTSNAMNTVESKIAETKTLLTRAKSKLTGTDNDNNTMISHTSDGGTIKYKIDSHGNKVEDLSDKETVETLKEQKEKKTIMQKMADGLGSLKGFIGGKVLKREKDGNGGGGLFSTLFKNIGKKVALAAGIGLASKFLLPLIKPLLTNVVKPFFSNVVKPFITKTLIPGIVNGVKTIAPVILNGIKELLPTIASGIGEAFKFAITDILPVVLPVIAGVSAVKLGGSLGKAAIKDLFTGKKTVKSTLKNFGADDIKRIKDKGLIGGAYEVVRHPLKSLSAVTKRGLSYAGTGVGRVISNLKGDKSKGVENASKEKSKEGIISKIGGGIKSVFSRNKNTNNSTVADTTKPSTAKSNSNAITKVASEVVDSSLSTKKVGKLGKIGGVLGKLGKSGKVGAIANIATDIVGDVISDDDSNNIKMLDNVDASSVEGPEGLIIKQIQITGQNIINAILNGGNRSNAGGDDSDSLIDTLLSEVGSLLPSGNKNIAVEAGGELEQRLLGKAGEKSEQKLIGRSGSKLLGKTGQEVTESTIKNGTSLLSKATGTLGKVKSGIKSITKGALAGGKGIISKIGTKVGKSGILNSMAKSTKNIGKLTENVSRKGIINQILDFLKGILSNSIVKRIIGEDAAIRIGNKLLPRVSKELTTNIAKASAKIIAKLTSAISTAGILNVAWAAADFVMGYNNAANILGITDEPSFGMKVVAGLVKATSGLLMITAIIPESTWVSLFVDIVLPILGEHDTKLQIQRQEAQEEVAKYNSENGTDLSLEDYNKTVKNNSSNGGSNNTNMNKKKKEPKNTKKKKDENKGIINTLWHKTVNTVSNVYHKGKNLVNKGIEIAKDKTKQVVNYVVDKGSAALNTVKNVGIAAKNGIVNGAKSAINFFTGNGEGEEERNNSNLTGMGGQKNSSGVKPQIKNNMVYYSQGDSRWADKAYGTASMKASACGPTSAAMVLSTLTGQTITPVDTAQYSLNNGFRVPNVGTDWGLFPSIGKKYGIDIKQTSDRQSILSALKKKQPVILSGQGAVPFTRGGHFVVAAGLDKNGNILINDPVNLERSKAYSQSTIWSGMKAGFIANKSIDGKLKDNTASGTVISTDEAQQQQQEQQQDNRPSAFNFFSDMSNAFKSGFEKMYNTRAGGFGEGDMVPIAMGDGGKFMVSNALINYIKYKEGFFSKPYYDSGGVLTIGYGSTHGPIMKKSSVTEAEATAALKDEVNDNAKSVANQFKKDNINPTQSQFDAVVDFVYNAGIGSYQTSTLRKRINSKAPYSSIKDAFLMWVKDDKGQTQPGLVTRRTDEAKMWNNEKGIAHYDGNGGTPVDASGSSGSSNSSSDSDSSQQEDSHSIFNIFSDLGNALKSGFDTMYGFNNSDSSSTSSDSSSTDGSTGNGEGGSNSTGILLNGTGRTADDFFTRTLNGKVTSGLDPNRKLMGQSSPHYGIDYAAKQGTPIKSPISGTVTTNSNEKDGFGNYLVIRDQNGQNHIFGHMKKQSDLKVGQKISQGQNIGNVGSTGFSTGSHLHYEVRDDRGTKLNPNKYLNSYASKERVDLTPAIPKTQTGNGKGGEPTVINNTAIKDSKYDKVLELILKALLKIADNSENLTKIVKILSENTNEATKKSIKENINKAKKSSSSKMPVTSILADSLKNNSDSGNEFIFRALETLASE